MTSGHPDWLRAFAMVGRHAGAYTVVTVDEDGQLYALLRGDYEGEPRTIALDDQGRISAFVVDSSDVWEDINTVGNAELAARLGSPATYDRTGHVQLIENFVAGLQRWDTGLSGLGAAVALSPSYFCSGGYSCKLVGGSTVACSAYIRHRRGLLPAGRGGLAARFSIDGMVDHIRFQVVAYDGVDKHVAQFQYVFVGHLLQVANEDGDWITVADLPVLATVVDIFHSFKIVFDFVTNSYVRLRFDGTSYDLADIDLYSTGDAMAPRLEVWVNLVSRATFNDVAYVDDVVLTWAEP